MLMCWKCTAENMDTCYEKGEIETCDSSADSCGLEERRWGGILVGVELGCKTRQNCHSDISANFIATTNQCRPTETGSLFEKNLYQRSIFGQNCILKNWKLLNSLCFRRSNSICQKSVLGYLFNSLALFFNLSRP